ncbi:hypothetical protein J2I47_24860 [Fibrella sp. HMF5335]|uniref:Uncharacterized protein n=1 Tax=Fibrella rubiginis TaxID=2817060 RepID=A0A939GLU9_9BACT|nr:hypothetical protein [Fibrella rubiginis]MBO0939800.1 hypothetical protein [Fibrella rubiginis]
MKTVLLPLLTIAAFVASFITVSCCAVFIGGMAVYAMSRKLMGLSVPTA